MLERQKCAKEDLVSVQRSLSHMVGPNSKNSPGIRFQQEAYFSVVISSRSTLETYRGSLPYAHFGIWKKPCYVKFMLVGL